MKENNGEDAVEKLWKGVIPGDREVTYFSEEKVDDKGDCGFIALGESRVTVAETLQNLFRLDDIRNYLWQEIYEAFETNRIPRTQEFEELYRLHQEPNLPENLYEARRKAIEEYCKSEDVFKMYTSAYRDKLWLGYKSALLYAQEKGITVYVWRKNNSEELEILDSHVEEDKGQIIHMLLTQGYSHYNLLVESQKPVKIADISSYVQKMPQLDFKNDTHYSFIEKAFLLTDEEVAEIFVVPAEEKKEAVKFKDLKRRFQLGAENNARSQKGKELFAEISILARSAFPKLEHPLLNEELKILILQAKQIVQHDAHLKAKSDQLPQNDVKSLDENEKPKSLSLPKENKVLVVVPKAVMDLSKGDFYSIIDKLEKPILEVFKSYGYTTYKKTKDSRAFVKDDGSSLEIRRNGEIRAEVNLKGDSETQAKICADKFIAMIMIYYQAAKKEGVEKVFPPDGLNMEMDLGNSKNAIEITNLTKMYVKKELAGPVLYSIKDRFSFNGENLFEANPQDKLNLSSALKSDGEMKDNSPRDDSKTLSDANSPRRSGGRAR